MNDYMVRATAAQGAIRAFAATSRNLVEEARQIHHTSPTATAALGRLLTAGSMMGAMMKNEQDILTLIVKGDGPLGGIVVTAQANAMVRGYVHNPQVWLPPKSPGHLDVGGAVGKGYLQVIRDEGLKEPYSGEVELVSGEIAEDLTYYFAASEQVPSAVGLGVLVGHEEAVLQAGGFILQLMPFASDEVVAALEERIKAIPSVTEMLSAGLTPETMLETLLQGMEPEITDNLPIGFSCNCSRQRVTRALMAAGSQELRDIIAAGKPVEVNCQFCGKHYNFELDEIRQILALSGGQAS